MIFDDIKESLRKALYKADNEMNIYFDESQPNLKFPFCNICLLDFGVEATSTILKTKYRFCFRIVGMQSSHNKTHELFCLEEKMKNALVPCIKIKNKKITLENITFKVSDKKLLMEFNLSFFEVKDDETELMQTLEINMKENNYAR